MSGVRELVVISGKGGTGKTSITAAFAALAGEVVVADCDVDAADLHLVLRPEPALENDFSGRSQAVIDVATCTSCGRCAKVCRFDAVLVAEDGRHSVDPIACEGCELCYRICPDDAVVMEPVVNGVWMVSDTPHGPLVHARLGVAEDNSGKLVTVVRNEARRVAEERGLSLVIVDGAPGIGCPVIASIAGADLVLAVTEPTVAGRHDLERVVGVVRHFGRRFGVCINKCDLNDEVAGRIEREATEAGAAFVVGVTYDPDVTRAQVAGMTVIEYGGRAATEIGALWDVVDGVLTEACEGRVRDE